ncbi:MAG: hypothetical protein PVJ27_08095 [Candidatus Brocadiaceae bacterium]|jgi:hypothetical protein
MHKSGRIVIYLAMALGLCCGLLAGASYSGEAELATVVQRLSAHQEQLRSLRCAWTAHHFIGGKAGDENLPPGVPDCQADFEEQGLLLLSGRDARCELRGMACHQTEGRYVPHSKVESYVDGIAQGDNPPPGGPVLGFPDTPPVDGLLTVYRLFHPVLGYTEPDELTLIGSATLEGQRCVVVEFVQSKWGQRNRLWLSREMDYYPLRWEHTGTALSLRADFSYEADDQIGWRLSSWEVVLDGSIPQSWECTVTDAEINPPLKKADLALR